MDCLKSVNTHYIYDKLRTKEYHEARKRHELAVHKLKLQI